MNAPACSCNNPAYAGFDASKRVYFGEYGRYSAFAIHTRFDSVQWLVADAESPEPRTGIPSIVRQCETFEDAVRDLA